MDFACILNEFINPVCIVLVICLEGHTKAKYKKFAIKITSDILNQFIPNSDNVILQVC